MLTLLAAVPVLAVLVLMTVFSWPAARSGVLAAGLTLLIAVTAFDFGGATDPFSAVGGGLGVLAEAAFIAALIIGIIGPALGIHHLQEATGASTTMRAVIGRVHPDPRVGALLVAWFFTLFLEGAAGFGTPVALAAPFLVALGMRPLRAVAAALVGHIAGSSFGAIGTPVLAQSALVDAGPEVLARFTAPYHVLLGAILVAVVVVLIGRGFGSMRGLWGWGALAVVAFFVPYGAIATFVGPELPTLGGAVIGAAAFVCVVAIVRRRDPGAGEEGVPAQSDHSAHSVQVVLRAASPYLVLIALVIVTRMVPVVRAGLESVAVDWETAGGFAGAVQPLFHPAMLLTVAFLAGALIQAAPARRTLQVFTVATRQLAPVVVALVAVVAIARTMSHSGMTDQLATAASNLGPGWPLAAPLIGALGAFITGSTTSSNVLFSELQESTAHALRLPAEPLLGAQGFGAAAGNMIAPHNIVAAAATVGVVGQEGKVMRSTLPVTMLYVLAGGLVALVFVRLPWLG